MSNKIKFARIDEDIPLFKNTMSQDYVLPEPSERQKEWADRMCRWLFSENDNEPVPDEALQFIEFMKMVHNRS